MSIYQHTYGDRTPFSYLICCTITNQVYYGIRYGKNCHPDQLWSTYFTSSKVVKTLIETHGQSAFTFEVRKVFDTPEKALAWEKKVLRRMRAVRSEMWLNESDGENFAYQETMSDAVKQKMSRMRKGIKRPRTPEHQEKINVALREHRKHHPVHNKGIPLSDETKRKLSEKATGRPSARKGVTNSDEHRRKISEAKKGVKPSKSITNHERQQRAARAIAQQFGDACRGLIWVNDGVVSKRIRPEEFESSGLFRGRLKP